MQYNIRRGTTVTRLELLLPSSNNIKYSYSEITGHLLQASASNEIHEVSRQPVM